MTFAGGPDEIQEEEKVPLSGKQQQLNNCQLHAYITTVVMLSPHDMHGLLCCTSIVRSTPLLHSSLLVIIISTCMSGMI